MRRVPKQQPAAPAPPASAQAGALVYVALRLAAERGFALRISTRICLAAATTVAQRGYAWHVKQTTGEHLLVPYGGLCNGVVGNAREGKPKEIAEERRHVQRARSLADVLD
jgi:hypothetical protein